jgi:hypothetical protein
MVDAPLVAPRRNGLVLDAVPQPVSPRGELFDAGGRHHCRELIDFLFPKGSPLHDQVHFDFPRTDFPFT